MLTEKELEQFSDVSVVYYYGIGNSLLVIFIDDVTVILYADKSYFCRTKLTSGKIKIIEKIWEIWIYGSQKKEQSNTINDSNSTAGE